MRSKIGMSVIEMNAKEQARKIVEMCDRLGWVYSIRGSIFTIAKKFQAGSNDGLVTCDMEYYSILELLPRTSPGSDWGTDCGGIGALSALKSGHFVMNRSGGSKRVLNALNKM
jgi:hypothetical protein